MKLVYLGKKNPKVVEIEGLGASFVPGVLLEVDDKLGKILLKNASDVFSAGGGSVKVKEAPKEELKEEPKEEPKEEEKPKKRGRRKKII